MIKTRLVLAAALIAASGSPLFAQGATNKGTTVSPSVLKAIIAQKPKSKKSGAGLKPAPTPAPAAARNAAKPGPTSVREVKPAR